MRVAVLEQEVKDKEQVIARSSDLLGSEQGQKVKDWIALWELHVLGWMLPYFGEFLCSVKTCVVFPEKFSFSICF